MQDCNKLIEELKSDFICNLNSSLMEEKLFRVKHIIEKNKNTNLLVQTLILIAKFYRKQNQFQFAMQYLYDASDIVIDPKSKCFILCEIGFIYWIMAKYDNALKVLLECESLSDSYKIINPQNVYSKIATAYIYKNDFDRAFPYLEKSLSCNDDQDDPHHVVTLINYTYAYIMTKEKDKALKTINRIIPYVDDVKPEVACKILNNMAEVKLMYKEYDEAVKYCKLALDKYCNLEKENDEVMGIYEILSGIYEKKQDFKTAFMYLKKYNNQKDGIYNRDTYQKLVDMQHEHELQKKELIAKQMLEKTSKLASIGVMAAGITHEINQPLNAIKLSADSVLIWKERNQDLFPDTIANQLENISLAADKISEIIKHMRTYWRAPDYNISKNIDFNETIRSALKLMRQQIASHAISLKSNLCNDIPKIDIKPVHLEQIIVNLVVNSIHALDSVEHKEKFIEISTKYSSDHIDLIVRDNGPGIQNIDKSQIYSPFFSTKSPDKSMGLGLAIIKQYIDDMNGSIIHNNIDCGLEVKISIPFTR